MPDSKVGMAQDVAEKDDTCYKSVSQSALQGGEAIPIQHSSYTGEMMTLFAEINSITDNPRTMTRDQAK